MAIYNNLGENPAAKRKKVVRLRIAQGADDDVEDDRAAQAPDMDRPGRRLGVVDDLRAADPGRELVSPIHGLS